MFFFGPITEVTAFASLQLPGKPVGDGVEAPDFSVAVLKFASGFVARLTCSVAAPRDHALKLFGAEGELRAEDCWIYQTPVTYRRWMRIRRRLMLMPWTNKVPLDPPPVGTKKGGGVGMDFIRGPIEAARAAREGRPSRVPLDFCIHVNEVALAIHYSAANPGTYTWPATSLLAGAGGDVAILDGGAHQAERRDAALVLRLGGMLQRGGDGLAHGCPELFRKKFPN